MFVLDFFTLAKSRVNKAVSKNRFNKQSDFEIKLKNEIMEKLNFNEEKSQELDFQLRATGKNITANEYFAQALVFSIAITFVGLVFFLLTQEIIMFLGLAVLGVVYYYNCVTKLKDEYHQIKLEVEKELPKFCSVICSKLEHTQNVENILKAYYLIASEKMKYQLDLVLLDISTSNVIVALKNFESRLHSPMLSDVCRGLIAVYNGAEQKIYFGVKQSEFNRHYKTMAKKEIDKRPAKIRIYQFLIFAFFMGYILYPLLSTNIKPF